MPDLDRLAIAARMLADELHGIRLTLPPDVRDRLQPTSRRLFSLAFDLDELYAQTAQDDAERAVASAPDSPTFVNCTVREAPTHTHFGNHVTDPVALVRHLSRAHDVMVTASMVEDDGGLVGRHDALHAPGIAVGEQPTEEPGSAVPKLRAGLDLVLIHDDECVIWPEAQGEVQSVGLAGHDGQLVVGVSQVGWKTRLDGGSSEVTRISVAGQHLTVSTADGGPYTYDSRGAYLLLAGCPTSTVTGRNTEVVSW